MDLGLSGKRAVVLGATRGLGLATATTLAAEGAHVVLCGRNAERLAQAVQALKEAGAKADYRSIDLAQPGQVNDFLGRVAGETVDILVNNTGGPPPGPISAVATEQWHMAFQSMVSSIFAITAAALPGMRDRKWGRIINIVSSGVIQPIPNLGMSNALRASIIGWAKTLANEVASDGITVNSVAPGRIHTERVDELDQAAADRTAKTVAEVAAQSRATIPAGRYGTPGEFADVVTFLASSRASYITGSLVRVDGGMIRSI
jgi:3-oxoacyl-[acyl-carrier protein] reductase